MKLTVPQIPKIAIRGVYSQTIHQLQVQELVTESLSIATKDQNLNNHNP